MLLFGIRARAGLLVAMLGCLLGSLAPKVVWAVDPSDVVQIQEDWVLTINDPDVSSNGPQITTTISPTSNLDSHHAAFEINYGSQPSYVAGGLQLQVWNNTNHFATKKHTETGSLNTNGEVIYWTQDMRVNNQSNTLSFQVYAGVSTTWGTFGNGNALFASVSTGLTNLNAYGPDFSVSNSGIGFASNRVTSLVLKQVRYVKYDGSVVVDAVPKTIYPKQ